MPIKTLVGTLTEHKLSPLVPKVDASYINFRKNVLYVCAIIKGKRVFRTYSLESNELIKEFSGSKQLPLKYYQRLVKHFNFCHKDQDYKDRFETAKLKARLGHNKFYKNAPFL